MLGVVPVLDLVLSPAPASSALPILDLGPCISVSPREKGLLVDATPRVF